MNLDRLLAPRSVAVVGASPRVDTYGHQALDNLVAAPLTRFSNLRVGPGRADDHGSWIDQRGPGALAPYLTRD